jgi:RimJ/RimL family protein N-acetyltransferase
MNTHPYSSLEPTSHPDITLREVVADDLPIFYKHQQDASAIWMAAFTAKDPSDSAAFSAHWTRILADDSTIVKTILVAGEVTGHIAKFEQFGEPEVTYWLGREHWGKGIASAALAEFLKCVAVRPLFGRAVKDNVASLRVMEKCGFVIVGEDKGYANGRSGEVEEYILRLE